MKNRKESFFSKLITALKPAVINFLRTKVVKLALKKIVGSAVAGGIYGWIITYIVEELYDEIAKPIIQMAFRQMGYLYEVKKGEHILKRIENADDFDEWHDAVNDA